MERLAERRRDDGWVFLLVYATVLMLALCIAFCFRHGTFAFRATKNKRFTAPQPPPRVV